MKHLHIAIMTCLLLVFILASSAPEAGAISARASESILLKNHPQANVRPVLQAASRLSPYGATDWNWTDRAMDAAKEAGITWARAYFNWVDMEPVQGQIAWTGSDVLVDTDFIMAQAQKYGMKVTAAVSLAPDWAKQPGLVLPQPALFANFVTTILNRYPGQIAAVEVLAEESTGKWPETKNRDALYYVPVLQAAYRAVKQVSPNTLVTTASLWGNPEGYLEDLYTLGAKGYFDVVNFHYYLQPNWVGSKSPTSDYTWWISHLRKVSERYGDAGRSIWLTEFAWTTTDEHRGAGRIRTIVSPAEQSGFLTYVLDASMKSGAVDKLFWYGLRADDGMALMHATNYYDWSTPQPPLVLDTLPRDTSLTVQGDWTTRWPLYGTLIADGEQMTYASLVLSGTNTLAQGLVRGVNGTGASSHASGATVYNRDQTANFKRQIFYTYKNFAQTYPTWDASSVAGLPDLPPPATSPVTIPSPGFESGTTAWKGIFTVDTSEKHSGTASARIDNTTGVLQRVGQRRLPVEPGKSYLLKGWVKIAPNGSGNMSTMVTVDLIDSAGTFLTTAPTNYYIYDTGGVWREIHYTFRTPATATQLSVYLSTSAGTGVAWFDDISIEPYTLQ